MIEGCVAEGEEIEEEREDDGAEVSEELICGAEDDVRQEVEDEASAEEEEIIGEEAEEEDERAPVLPTLFEGEEEEFSTLCAFEICLSLSWLFIWEEEEEEEEEKEEEEEEEWPIPCSPPSCPVSPSLLPNFFAAAEEDLCTKFMSWGSLKSELELKGRPTSDLALFLAYVGGGGESSVSVSSSRNFLKSGLSSEPDWILVWRTVVAVFPSCRRGCSRWGASWLEEVWVDSSSLLPFKRVEGVLCGGVTCMDSLRLVSGEEEAGESESSNAGAVEDMGVSVFWEVGEWPRSEGEL